MRNPSHHPHQQPAQALPVISDDERLRMDIYRSDREKLRLFTNMIRANNLFKRAKVTHK